MWRRSTQFWDRGVLSSNYQLNLSESKWLQIFYAHNPHYFDLRQHYHNPQEYQDNPLNHRPEKKASRTERDNLLSERYSYVEEWNILLCVKVIALHMMCFAWLMKRL